MNPNDLKRRSEAARSVFLRGLLGSQAMSTPSAQAQSTAMPSAPSTPTPTPPLPPTRQVDPYKRLDLRTFQREDLDEQDNWAEEDVPPTIDMQSIRERLLVLRAATEELSAYVLPIAIGLFVRIANRITGDNRIILICICTSVLLCALLCVVMVPYKKRAPFLILLSLFGLWLGGL